MRVTVGARASDRSAGQSESNLLVLTQIADIEQSISVDNYPNRTVTNMFSNLFNFQKQKGEQDPTGNGGGGGGGGKETSSKAKLSVFKNKNKKQQQQQPPQQPEQPQQPSEPPEEEEIQVRYLLPYPRL